MRNKYPTKRLGEVCVIYQPKTISTKEMIDDGKYAVYGANGIIGRYDKFNHEDSEILVTCRGATCGTVNVSEPMSWINGNAMVVKPQDSALLDKDFLRLYLLGVIDISKVISGSAQPQITREKLSPSEIPLPPLPEQKKIVARIERAFAKIDEAARLRAAADEDAAEIMKAALDRVFARVKEKGWEERKLDAIFEINRGGSPRPIRSYITDAADGINWIKIGDAQEGTKYITSTAQKITRIGLKKTRLVREGDLLLSNSMSFGHPYIMKTGGAIHDGWLLLRARAEDIDLDYAYYILGSQNLYRQFEDVASGAVVKNLNTSLVSRVKIPLPPLPEQKKIARELDALAEKARKLRQLQSEVGSDLKELKQAILRREFGG